MKWFKKLLAFFMFAFISLGLMPKVSYASWNAGDNQNDTANSTNETYTSSVQEPVAYIAGSNKIYFPTIEGALKSANSGDIVVTIPPKKQNYHSVNNKISVDSVTYKIKDNCEIKQGVTLILPTDKNNIDSVNNQETLETYIKSMWKDSRNLGSTDKDAINHSTNYLRTTVEIESGKTLINNGTLVISGYLYSGTNQNSSLISYTGFSYSRFLLKHGAAIIQNSSTAITHCYGYIEEDVKNNNSYIDFANGTVYMPLVVCDYRGFSVASGMEEANNTYGVPPFNQIEFRNIFCTSYFRYNAKLYGCSNVYVYQTGIPIIGTIDEVIANNDSLIISNGNAALVKLTNSTYSYLEAKYDKDKKIMNLKFYGGFSLNTFSFKIKISGVEKTLSTANGFFPVSYKMNISLLRNSNQSGRATFSTLNQKIKLLPEASLAVSNNVDLNGSELTVYSTFIDNSSGERPTSKWSCGAHYPVKNNANCIVEDGGKITMQKIGGNVYCNDSANIIYSSSDIVESNEPWNQDVRSAPFVIKDYLIIREQLSISSLEKINSKKILIGMNTFFNSNDFPNPNKPKLNVINNGEQWQINGVQKVLHVDSVTNAQLELLNNIYNVNVFKGNNNVFGTSSRYAYRSYINNASNVVFCVINSLPSISSNNNGINEFDVQSITVESTTGKLDNGKDPLYINHSIQLKANLIDVEKAYNKDVIWSSSNTSIATVDETGKVTGVNLGQVVITATSSYHSEVFGTYNTEVIPDDSLVGVTSVWITSSTNKSSKTVVGTSSEHDGVSGITVAQNWSYHEEVTSTDTTITYSLKWEPSNGQISQVQWTFYSPTGEREYMVDYSGTKVANKTTIDDDGSRSTKIHFDGRTNQKPDACVLRCKVTDINNTEYSCDFNIMHNSGVCVTGNTLVTMADGSYKAIKDVKLGELVKTWSFKEGAFVNRPIIWYESGTMQNADVITVVFDDGSKVEAIWKQSFFDAELLDYVTIDSSNYSSFIGKKLLSDIGTSTIGYKRVVDAYVENKDTEYYEIDTMYDYQYLANNILTVEPTLHEHVWFEVTPEFKYDPIKMEQDLEKYGPLDYNLVKDLVTYDQYLWWGGEYLAVPIGKGYFTLDYLIEVIKQFINDNYEVA